MTIGQIQVLLVEDDAIDQMAFRRLVTSEELPYDYTIAGSVGAALKILGSGQKFDIILLDYHLGDGYSLELFETIDFTETLVIFATGTGDENTAVQAMKAGAYDYLIKDPERNYLKVLPATIDNAIKRKEADEQVKMLYHAVMSSTDSIYITDMAGTITFVNSALCETYGYEAKDLLGRREHILIQQKQEIQKGYHKLTTVGEKNEIYHKRKDGREFPVSVSRSFVQDESGREKAVVVVAHDITERKNIEQELRALNASKDKFFSIVSHDLKSPFAPIVAFSEMLAKEIDTLSQRDIRYIAESISTSATKLAKLLDNLLQWSSIQTSRQKYQPVVIDLKQMITHNLELLRDVAAAKGIDLTFQIEEKCYVFADGNMINSVIQNLISNAIKFTDRGGQIRVMVGSAADGIELSVADTGVGMSPDEIEKLFRIDVHHSTPGTAQEKGTGLGLILCKEFIELNHGEIWVESELGCGSIFTFRLPPLETHEARPFQALELAEPHAVGEIVS
jgi:PAS domain S-box-containing protein